VDGPSVLGVARHGLRRVAARVLRTHLTRLSPGVGPRLSRWWRCGRDRLGAAGGV